MTPQHVVEIGAGDSHSSQVLATPDWLGCPRIELYEPHRLLADDLALHAPPHATVTQAAVAMYSGVHPLIHLGYASYLARYPSFLNTSCEPEAEQHWLPLTKSVVVHAMDAIDDGAIDALILTCNGAEMECLMGMRSRPAVIRTRHYCHSALQWTELNKVARWLMDHAYSGVLVETNEHRTLQAIEWRKV